MRLILKEKRKERKLTQAEMAVKLGISRSAYTNIETGIRNPSLKTSLAMKKALDYKEDDIFENHLAQ